MTTNNSGAKIVDDQPMVKFAHDMLRVGKGNLNYALYKLLQQFLYDYHVAAEPWGTKTEYGGSFNTDQFCKDYAEAIKAVCLAPPKQEDKDE